MKSCVGVSLLLHVCVATIFACMTGRDFSRIRKSEVIYFMDIGSVCSINKEEHPATASSSSSRPLKSNAAPTQFKQNAAVIQEQAAIPAPVMPPLQSPKPQDVWRLASQNAETSASGSAGRQIVTADSTSEGGRGRQGGSEGISPSGNANGVGAVAETEFASATGPSFMQRVLPVYPMVARRFNREGKVVLRLTIDAGGSLLAVEVLQDPGYGFAAAAVEAVKRSRFHPARYQGRPVMARGILPVRFSLKGIN